MVTPNAPAQCRKSTISKGNHWHATCEPMRVRVLVVDECAGTLREGLRLAGYEVAASLRSPRALLRTVAEVQPDAVAIDTESPSRELLEHLAVLTRHTPRPVILFATDSAPETIREAV